MQADCASHVGGDVLNGGARRDAGRQVRDVGRKVPSGVFNHDCVPGHRCFRASPACRTMLPTVPFARSSPHPPRRRHRPQLGRVSELPMTTDVAHLNPTHLLQLSHDVSHVHGANLLMGCYAQSPAATAFGGPALKSPHRWGKFLQDRPGRSQIRRMSFGDWACEMALPAVRIPGRRHLSRRVGRVPRQVTVPSYS